MKLPFLIVLTALFATLPGATGFAQEYHFVDWSQRGVPRDAVTALAQDQRGFVWAATARSGLLRLDGRRVHVFEARELERTGRITALAADGSGTLFAGGQGGLVAIRLGARGNDRVDTVLTALLAGIDGPVRRLRMSAARRLHVETGADAWDADLRDSSVVRVRSAPPPWEFLSELLAGYALRGMAKDCIGQYWLATDRGLVLKNDGGTHLFDSSNGLCAGGLLSVLVDREMNVWCGVDDGLFMHVPARFTRMVEGNPLPRGCGEVQCLLETDDRALWLGTARGGLLRLLRGPLLQLSEDDGLPSASVTALLELPSGEVLVGTDAGMMICDGEQVTDAPAGLHAAGRAITALLQAADRSYWVGTETGLLRWSGTEDTFTVRTADLPSPHVHALAEDAFGFVWVGTERGLVRLAADEGDAYMIPEMRGVPVTALHRDRKDRIWIGTRGAGVYVRSEGLLKRLGMREGLASEFIASIAEDNFGSLYFGTNRGVTVLPGENLQFVIPVDTVRSVGRRVPTAQIPFLGFTAMFTYTSEDGLISGEMALGAALRDRSGLLWFGEPGGAVRLVPSQAANVGAWRPPTCRNLREPRSPVRYDIMLTALLLGDTSAGNRSVVELADGQSLRGRLLLPSFRNPDNVSYLYRLDGLERAWHRSRGGEVLYAGLPPGEYTLIAQAGMGEGIWSRRQELLTIVVPAPLYHSPWFWLVLLLFAGLIGFMLQKHTHVRQLAALRRRL